jgi:hypothetical protein
MKAWLWGVVAALVVAVAAVTVVVVLNSGGGDGNAEPDRQAPSDGCPPARTAVLYFETDEQMRAAAEQVRRDPEVAEVVPATKAENYEHFKELFADEEEVLENARVEAIPASVEVRPVPGVDVGALRERLEDEVPDVDGTQNSLCPPEATR